MTGHFTLSGLLGAALLGALPAQLHAAPVSVDTSARTIVLHPLRVLKLADLDFGSVIVTGAGTIVLNPANDAVTATGGVLPVAGAPHAAHFIGAASGNSVVNIKLPKQPVTLRRISGTETMTLTNFTLDSPDKRTMARGGSFEFKVGGTVNVGGVRPEGTYVGTFTVTVQYP